MKIWIEGTTRRNEDGASRSDLIRGLASGAPLNLRREALAFDPNAVAVTDAEGRILGYLPSDAARTAAIRMEAKGNASVTATVAEIKAGSDGNAPELAIEIDVEAPPAAENPATPEANVPRRIVITEDETTETAEAEKRSEDEPELPKRNAGRPKHSEKQRLFTGLTVIVLVLLYFAYKYYIKQ